MRIGPPCVARIEHVEGPRDIEHTGMRHCNLARFRLQDRPHPVPGGSHSENRCHELGPLGAARAPVPREEQPPPFARGISAPRMARPSEVLGAALHDGSPGHPSDLRHPTWPCGGDSPLHRSPRRPSGSHRESSPRRAIRPRKSRCRRRTPRRPRFPAAPRPRSRAVTRQGILEVVPSSPEYHIRSAPSASSSTHGRQARRLSGWPAVPGERASPSRIHSTGSLQEHLRQRPIGGVPDTRACG